MFLATSDGVVVIDPLHAPFAQWLKAELEKMFPNQRVTFVVYTGIDSDRIGGAGVFDPSAFQ